MGAVELAALRDAGCAWDLLMLLCAAPGPNPPSSDTRADFAPSEHWWRCVEVVREADFERQIVDERVLPYARQHMVAREMFRYLMVAAAEEPTTTAATGRLYLMGGFSTHVASERVTADGECERVEHGTELGRDDSQRPPSLATRERRKRGLEIVLSRGASRCPGTGAGCGSLLGDARPKLKGQRKSWRTYCHACDKFLSRGLKVADARAVKAVLDETASTILRDSRVRQRRARLARREQSA